MTSKISYFKLIKSNMKQRVWYGALALLGFFLALPLPVMIWRDMEKSQEVVVKTTEYQEYVVGLLQGKIGALGFLVIALALLGAWTGLSYLHSKKKMDFYGSLPVRREELLICGSLETFLLFTGAYLFNVLLLFVIMTAEGIMSVPVFQAAMTGMGIHLLFFLFTYFTAAIAMLLTGKVFVGILGTGVLLSVGPILYMIYQMLPDIFFQHYVGTNNSSWIQAYLSPVFTYINVIAGSREEACGILQYDSVMGPLIFAGVGTVLLAGLALWLIRIRPAESAEKAMAFSKTEGPVKGVILYMVSILAGIFFFEMFSRHKIWLWFFMIFSFMIFSIVIEIIYHQDRRKLLGHKLSTGISCGLVVCTILYFQLDITGYDSWVPGEDQVESAIVFCEEWKGYYFYNEERKEYIGDHMEQYHNPHAVAIAKEGIKCEDDQEGYWEVEIWYQMKNGKIKKRSYGFTEEIYTDIRNDILDDKVGRTLAYPVLLEREESVFCFAYLMDSDEGKCVDASELTMAQREEILQLYLEELETVESSYIQETGMTLGNTKQETQQDYPLNDRFVKTVEKVNEYWEEAVGESTVASWE